MESQGIWHDKHLLILLEIRLAPRSPDPPLTNMLCFMPWPSKENSQLPLSSYYKGFVQQKCISLVWNPAYSFHINRMYSEQVPVLAPKT